MQPRSSIGNATVLYHATDPAAADSIMQSRMFLRGSAGLCGGGMCFATTPFDTLRKHQNSSDDVKIIRVSVQLGKVRNAAVRNMSTCSAMSLCPWCCPLWFVYESSF